MNVLLRPVRSFDPPFRRIRALEEGGPRLHDLDTPEDEAKSHSSPFVGHRHATALRHRLSSWQARAIGLITLLGPPLSSLILLSVYKVEYWRAIPFNLADFLAAVFVFAIPVGYVFGLVPALVAASLYCALLTANSRLLQRRLLIRGCVAAMCGGLASWVWFCECLSISLSIYPLVGALVTAALSLISPATGQAPRMAATGDGSDARPRSAAVSAEH